MRRQETIPQSQPTPPGKSENQKLDPETVVNIVLAVMKILVAVVGVGSYLGIG